MPETMIARRGRLNALAPSELGLVGQVTTSWGLAGGMLAALVVTAHMVTDRLSASLGFLTITLFYVGGSLIAFLHGAILAYLGRPAGVSRHDALQRLALGAAYAVPLMVAGWGISLAVALSAVALRSGRPGLLLLSSIGWLITLTALAWAWLETRTALQNLYRRWPAGHAILVVLALAFLALLPVFLTVRPAIWLLGVRPTGTAAILMALGATLWIGGPLAVLGALGIRAWTRRHPEGHEAG
ncbi:MAG TPA: hypothetical protein VMM12_02085 [Longimicrobiales bacterium]|nr:hypothetical protein [Longimicrobiales bacterium]